MIELSMHFAGLEGFFGDCWSLSDNAQILTMEQQDTDLGGPSTAFERVC